MGRQIVQQLFTSPRVLGVTAGILIFLGLIPGMPHMVFLTMGALLGYMAPGSCTAPEGATRRRRSPARAPAMAKPPGTTCSPWTCWGWSWATA